MAVPPGLLTFTAPAGFTIHNAPRIDEVYVEAETSIVGTAQLDQVYVEADSVLAATAQLAQVYVEADSVLAATAQLAQVYVEVWYTPLTPLTVGHRPLRLTQRDDGLGVTQHARLQAGSLPNAATSTQLGQVPRIGTNNRYG